MSIEPRGTLPGPADALRASRVLVVEDEALIAMQVESVLADAGCELVGPATGVAEAVGLVTAAAPQAALLDVNLGRERSYPVADLLAAGGVPFVFCTGYAGATELPERFAGARVLPKPLDPDELVRALADVAAGPRPRSQMAV